MFCGTCEKYAVNMERVREVYACGVSYSNFCMVKPVETESQSSGIGRVLG